MNNTSVELLAALLAEVVQRSGRGAGAEATWVAEAVREKLAACAQIAWLERRAAQGSRDTFLRVLGKVPDARPQTGDEFLD